MKIIKYILLIAIGMILWVTAPIWMPKSNYYSPDRSQVDTLVSEQEAERNAIIKAEDKKLAELEAKFGNKSSVIPAVKKHWAKKYRDDDSFEWLRCSKVKARANGWTSICSYRLKGAIQQNTYIINNGNVSH